jgi:hypothetical protein
MYNIVYCTILYIPQWRSTGGLERERMEEFRIPGDKSTDYDIEENVSLNRRKCERINFKVDLKNRWNLTG